MPAQNTTRPRPIGALLPILNLHSVFTGLAGVLALAALGPASPAGAATIRVNVFDFDFSSSAPTEPITDPTINVGDTIRWVWLDDHHTTTAALHQDEYWRSDLFDAGDSFEHTFEIPGVYWYYCEPHGLDLGDGTAAGMAGTITVVPARGAAIVVGGALTPFLVRSRRFRKARTVS